MDTIKDGLTTICADLEQVPGVCNNGTDDRLVALPVVAAKLGVSTRSIHRLIAAGQFPPPVKVGGASRWFLSDIASYIDGLRQGRSKIHPAQERDVA
jgi:predicted DNA-binding transcriptional regulator AlpA